MHAYRPGNICGEGTDEGFFGTSVDRVLHLFIVDVLNCFIAIVRGIVREANRVAETGSWRL